MPKFDDLDKQSPVNEVESHSTISLTWTEEEEKRLVRKIDLLLMPTIWLMYLLSYMVCLLVLEYDSGTNSDRIVPT